VVPETEFNSSANIIPSAGTYNTVSKIDTEISSLQSSVTTNTSDITTLLSGGTVFTTSGSYIVPSNVATITIEAMGGGGGGSSAGTGSDGAWAGGGGGASGALEKISIPVTIRQVIDFTIGVGGAQPTQSGGNGIATTVTMYGQTLWTANRGYGSTGIDGGNGATTSSTGVSCGRGGGMGSVNTSTYGSGGTGTIPGQASTIYETQGTVEKSRNPEMEG